MRTAIGIDDDFLKKTFLGFSYLVPQVSNENEQQKYYSSVFRNINIQGKSLLPQESRASLYFLDPKLVEFFSPDFSKDIKIKVGNTESQADFVRYLSLLSQYHKDQSETKVAKGYKSNMEKFYEEYIYASVNNEQSEIYDRFSDIFQNREYEVSFSSMRSALDELEIVREYISIIDLDIYLFGLTYQILFNKKEIDAAKKDDLKQELEQKIREFKQDDSHKKSPNNLDYLRKRIRQSILIYEKYSIQ